MRYLGGYTGTLASLTLGGYDAARFEPNNLAFDLGPDNERDIVVGIRSINVTGNGVADKNMLSGPTYAYIDSTVPQIWLPLDACREFEDTFGLMYDDATELYLVNNSLHNQLLSQNPNITFTLGVGSSGGDTIDIVLPYASFDLTALPPYQGLANQSLYFPLRRAANETQYTLGRTFLQEAYLIVDWENANFSVSQCVWPSQMGQSIIAIEPPLEGDASNYGQTPNASSSPALSIGAIVGIVIGAVAVISILLLLLALYYRRTRRRNAQDKVEQGIPEMSEERGNDQVFPKAELPAVEPVRRNGKDKDRYTDEGNPFDDPNSPRPTSSISPSSPGSPGSPGTTGTGFFNTHFPSGSGVLSIGVPGSPTSPVEVDNKQREIYEMPGDAPARQEMDAPPVGEKKAMMMRERIYNGVDPLPSPTSGNGRDDVSNRGDNTVRSSSLTTSSVQPGDIISPVSSRDRSSHRESNTLRGSTLRSSTLTASPVSPRDVISPVHPGDRGVLSPVPFEDRGPISPLQPEFNRFRFSFEGQPSEPSDLSDPSRSAESSLH